MACCLDCNPSKETQQASSTECLPPFCQNDLLFFRVPHVQAWPCFHLFGRGHALCDQNSWDLISSHSQRTQEGTYQWGKVMGFLEGYIFYSESRQSLGTVLSGWCGCVFSGLLYGPVTGHRQPTEKAEFRQQCTQLSKPDSPKSLAIN